ncbi:MAG: AAA family ATPase [Muribaculaceae bacterium]|nr:AAA family ATPase [Muribaculaceae bacterium]
MKPLQLISANEIEVKEVQWLWYPYIPSGKITLLQGDPGDGKSSFVLALCALLTSGQPLPFQPRGQPPVNVIYQTTEDDAEDTVVPRFLRAGGDRQRLFFISEKERRLTFGDERITQAIRQTNARLLVLDPLSSYIGQNASLNMANDVRAQFNPLIDAARETDCAVLVVAHLNKMAGTKAIYRTTGSIDVVGAVRSALLIARTGKERPDERVMVVQKSNLAPTGKALLFSVGDTVEWISETDKTADEVLNCYAPCIGRPSIQTEQAAALLQSALANGSVPQTAIEEQAKAAGIGWGTVKRAKAALGVRSIKKGSVWLWSLPP